MEICGLTFTHIVTIMPGAKLQVLGTPLYIQGESKVYVALQELITS